MAHDVQLPQSRRETEPRPAILEGPSREIRRLRDRVEALAGLAAPVLVCGEPGTGRRAVAELLHGHEGALRVAAPDRPPDALPLRGTVLLHEVEELSAEMQLWWRKRLVQGGMSARLVAIARAPLADHVGRGCYDAELAACLERFVLRLPALRERATDLPSIILRAVRSTSEELGRGPVELTSGALRRLAREPWPGNLPELLRVVERLVAFHAGRRIGLAEVEEELDEVRPSLEVFRERQRSRERAELMRHLEDTGGNVAETAQRMARSRPAIYRLVEKHGIALRRGR